MSPKIVPSKTVMIATAPEVIPAKYNPYAIPAKANLTILSIVPMFLFIIRNFMNQISSKDHWKSMTRVTLKHERYHVSFSQEYNK